MRPLPFLLLAYLVVAVQFALGGALGWGEWTPNLVLLAVVFLGLHAQLEPAMVGGLVLGLMHDVIASHGLGTYALAYPLIAAAAVQLKGGMYNDHLATHVAMPLLLGVGLVLYLLLRQWIRNLYFPPESPVTLGGGVMGVLITAAIAIPFIGALRRVRRRFAFDKR